MASDMFSQNCRLRNILDSWKTSVQCLVDEAHDLERGRKDSEHLSRELRCHVDAFGKQFDQIKDKVPMPPPASSPGPGSTSSVSTDQQCVGPPTTHDETLEKEFKEIRSQLEATRQRISSLGAGNDAAVPPVGSTSFGPCPPPAGAATCPDAGPEPTDALADFSKSPVARRTSLDLFSSVGKQPQIIGSDMDHNHKCGREGRLPPGGQQHGDVMSDWRSATPANPLWPNLLHRRNVLEHQCPLPPVLPPRPPSAVGAALADISIQEVDKNGKFVRLANRSATKDEQIGCCILQQAVNGHTTVVFRFPPCTTLPALGTVTIWSGSGRCAEDGPNINFRFRELKAWGTGSEYTTIFRRANGQTIAFVGGGGRGGSKSCKNGDGDGDEDDASQIDAEKVPIVKNSMTWRLNNNKSDCIRVQKTERFKRRVITSNGDTGKPQCGVIAPAPGGCDAHRKLITDDE